MDERLQKALNHANYMVTLDTQKRILKEKFYENLYYFTNGSQFTVTKDLINFVSFLVNNGNDKDVVLIDDNDIPVNIENLSEFLDNIMDLYFSSANEYFQEYTKLKSKRTVEKLADYE